MTRPPAMGYFSGANVNDAGIDVHQRIIGDHALVHAVEGQLLTVITPECSL